MRNDTPTPAEQLGELIREARASVLPARVASNAVHELLQFVVRADAVLDRLGEHPLVGDDASQRRADIIRLARIGLDLLGPVDDLVKLLHDSSLRCVNGEDGGSSSTGSVGEGDSVAPEATLRAERGDR